MHTVGRLSSNGYLGRCEGAIFAEIPGKVFLSPSHRRQKENTHATLERAHSWYGRLDYVRGRFYPVLGIADHACWRTNVSCSALQTERRGLPNHGSTVSSNIFIHVAISKERSLVFQLTNLEFCRPIRAQRKCFKTSTGIDSFVDGTWWPCGNEWSRIHQMLCISSRANNERILQWPRRRSHRIRTYSSSYFRTISSSLLQPASRIYIILCTMKATNGVTACCQNSDIRP